MDERYAGVSVAWRHERRRTKNDKKGWCYRAPEDREALPEGTIPALVDQATWDACQARLRTNKLTAARNNPDPTAALLRGGLVRCAYCRREDDPETGRAMVVANATPRRPGAYRCVAMRPDGGQCTNAILIGILDGAVWAHVRALVREPALVRAHFRQLATDDPTTGEGAGIAVALRECQREVENLTANLGLVTGRAAEVVAAAIQAKTEALASLERQRRRRRGAAGRCGRPSRRASPGRRRSCAGCGSASRTRCWTRCRRRTSRSWCGCWGWGWRCAGRRRGTRTGCGTR